MKNLTRQRIIISYVRRELTNRGVNNIVGDIGEYYCDF